MFSPRYVYCLFVRPSGCKQHYGKTDERAFVKFVQGTFWNLFGMFSFTLSIQDFLIFFRWNPCLLSTLWENWWTDFHEIIRTGQTWDNKQSGIFRGCCVQAFGSMIDSIFLGLCLYAILRKMSKHITRKFTNMLDATQHNNWRDCFPSS